MHNKFSENTTWRILRKQHMCYQQEGISFGTKTILLLKEKTNGRVTSKTSNWPPKKTDLTTFDYFH